MGIDAVGIEFAPGSESFQWGPVAFLAAVKTRVRLTEPLADPEVCRLSH
jgi:hypothetical protein